MRAPPAALFEARPTLKLGKKHALHLPHVLIEDNRVVVRTRCGMDPLVDGFTETYGVPTCEPCLAGEA